MASDQTLAWMYAEELCEESEALSQARAYAEDFDVTCVTAAAGAFLRFLVRTSGASSIAEVGTGTGVSGLYLLASDNVTLTSIDIERETQHVARNIFASEGIRTGRSRLINGRSADLLPRLAASAYDMVVLDGDPLETPGDVEEAFRLLRTGGLIVIPRALMGGKVADPARREDAVVTMRTLVKELLASPDVDAAIVPVGDGMLVATLL